MRITEEQAVRVARVEVAQRSLGVTQQILAVNSVVVQNGEPEVARVTEVTSVGQFAVWFPLRDQEYFFVVFVESDRDGKPQLAGSCWHARVRAWLVIASTDVSAAEITARTGLSPTEVYERGDVVKFSPTRTYNTHSWVLEPQRDVPGTVDEKLSELLLHAGKATDAIAGLRPACSVEVVIIYSGWGGDPQFGGWHVDAKSLQSIAALGAEMDVDMYAMGPEFPG
jgi:Domain of unknown function (DUF4279)